MNKARNQILETLPKVDLVIEVLDARIPYSSQNPMLEELRGDKPVLKVMSKSDLADERLSAIWKAHFEKEQGVKARLTTTNLPGPIRRLTEVCVQMVPHKHEAQKPIVTMIVGIPNVGKSTLINILAGRIIARTGNEPAITKMQQRIALDNGITLLDTPGVLWPNVENEKSGYRLAATGAVKDTAMEYDDVAFVTAKYLMTSIPERIIERYSLEFMPDEVVELMETIGRGRGCMKKGGLVDYDKVSRIFLNDLRQGKLGPITLETPEMMEREKVEVVKEQEAKEAKKVARRQKRALKKVANRNDRNRQRKKRSR